MHTTPTIDTDRWNVTEDLVRVALALAGDAKWFGERSIAHRGRALRCVRSEGRLVWTIDGQPTTPQALPAAFGCEPYADQAAVLARLGAR